MEANLTVPWSLSRLAIDGGNAPPAFMIQFDARQFDFSMFSRHSIAVPATISRSVQKRQAEFFFGRYCASMALTELGIPASDIVIGPSREPVWPSTTIGSITHTRTVAAAIALPRGRHSGVGIDIEYIVGVDAHAALRSEVIDAKEFAYLTSIATFLPLDLSLTLVFSAKESFFKAVFYHVRRHINFNEVIVTDISPINRTITLELRESLSYRLRRRQSYRLYFRKISMDLVLTSFLW